MSLEDYIRDQERKAKNASENVKTSVKDMWEDAKQAGRKLADRTSDALNR